MGQLRLVQMAVGPAGSENIIQGFASGRNEHEFRNDIC